MVGKSLSHYKILAELGRGGMGIVYKAEDTSLDRVVALKVLPSAALASEEDRARFYREAKASAQLNHPHIASVFQVDEAVPSDAPHGVESSPFIAMEYIDGDTLSGRIEKGPLRLEEAVRIASEIASGLDAAHEKNIVHRDIKSQNVMLTTKDSAKVLDFGLAQTAASTKLTRMGATMGTVSYMSPEQARGEEVDSRTDLWSLGVVLYEMVSGKHPFPGDYEQAVVYEILNQEPEPLTALRTGVPMELERIVEKCLAKDAKHRYQHADDLIADLDGMDVRELKHSAGSGVANQTAVVEKVDAESPRRWLLPVAFVATAILASVATWVATSGEGGSDAPYVTAMNRVTIEPVTVMYPSIHPAGDHIVYAAGKTYDKRLYYRLIEGGPPKRLVEGSEKDENYPSYSPDGNLVLFESGGSIFTVEALGGIPRPIIKPVPETAFYQYPTWSPTGKAIAYTSNNDSVHVLQLGASSPYLSVPFYRSHSLSWSPDGKYLAVVRLNTGHATRGTNIAPTSIWLMDTTEGTRRRITTEEFMDLSPKWAPDASALFYISNQGGGLDVYRQAISGTGEAIGRPERLTTGLNLHSIDLSNDGLRLVAGELSYRQNIWASELKSGAVASARDAIPITSGDQVIEGIDISPDGTRLAYDSNARGLAHLFVMPLSGGTAFQVTSRDEPDFLYDWSPYTDELAFHTFREGSRDIGIVSDDGLTYEIVSDEPVHGMWPFWLVDENTIAFHRFAAVEGGFELVRSNRDSSGNWGTPEVIIEELLIGARWSAARNLLAYFSFQNLYLWDPETGQSRTIADVEHKDAFRSVSSLGTSVANWSRDGNTIYFRAVNNEGNESFWAVSADGGLPRMIVDLTGVETGLGLSAVDDHRIYYTISEIESDIWVLDLAR
ncbi:MAG: hypothetical protein BMS9Abin05_1482 [Rhodothermia bacterium]|nr:MAG: hypothetical protein BMS9Abin05_1482 [Rhodothermia bacterium]